MSEHHLAICLLVLAVLLSGCVAADRYDAAVEDARSTHVALGDAVAQISALKAGLQDAQVRRDACEQSLAGLSTRASNLQAHLDEATAIDSSLRAELERLGENVDQMLGEHGSLATALQDARQRLDELRKAQAAAQARIALFHSLVDRFGGMIDSGQLRIVTRDGRLVIQLPGDDLFASGEARIEARGRATLQELAAVLQTLPGRSFQVAGDTDDVPIHTWRYPSNWELSTERAARVVEFLIARGVDPRSLSAVGCAEYDPIASNDTSEGRALNRRIEIILEPNQDEFVAVPAMTSPAEAPARASGPVAG